MVMGYLTLFYLHKESMSVLILDIAIRNIHDKYATRESKMVVKIATTKFLFRHTLEHTYQPLLKIPLDLGVKSLDVIIFLILMAKLA